MTATLDEIRTGLSYSDFRSRYLRPRLPVVLRSAMEAMPAVRRWNLAFFEEQYGTQQVPIDGLQSGNAMTLSEYVHTIGKSAADSTHASVLYMRNLPLFERFPELKKDFWMPWIASPSWLQSRLVGDYSGHLWRFWVELFLSGPGSRFPFVHIDPYLTHAWSVQLSGAKVFWLWPTRPDELSLFISGSLSWRNSRQIDKETDYQTFFSDRSPIRVVLSPGDLLYIPAGWWHTTETLEAAVTLGGNFVEASNWVDFAASYRARNPTHNWAQALKRRAATWLAPAVLPWLE